MQYKQIKSKKIYEVVTDELVQMISSGQLKPGDKLDSVEQLAENFQVGRSAIREALSALRVMGLVEMRQGEGTYIKEYNPSALSNAIFTTMLMKEKDIQDLLEVRKILEIGAVRAAAINWKKDDLERILKALDDMRVAVGSETLGEQADLDFHIGIAKASHNALLEHMMVSVSEIMGNTMRETRRLWIYSKETTLERLYQEHIHIYEAIRDRDATKAEERMITHLVKVEDVLINYLLKNKK